ncbi:rubrerythrin family protein [Methanonatronarchaeum sp. AMET6-2]|uniref:rubrerythrin family protein n=1 Tax=Methanonatronarchaeum sp. AMET6-2 TaxID=2933293 RepID=UPI001FF682BB|nr:rubrerythrin family protein [Methanonatronarchaeum sp. AMET6-2]UOY10481.1 rubrerythrin family protein [Methanonatronarchaeum sp. AMET6-2]
MSDTEDGLKEAFAGESQARNKYEAYSRKAEEDGFTQVAKLFKAASEAERVHAKNHFENLDAINNTDENLKDAIEGEKFEHEDMYPKFVEAAKEEGEDGALESFLYAMEVEKVHEILYKDALEAVENDEDLQEKDIWVCQICGNTVRGEAPDPCPICGYPKKKFDKVEL